MITIFTPTYNRKENLKNLYESLINQTFKNFEWLIVDDGSTDGTEEYIKNLKSKSNININYIYKSNGGKPSAYNVALEHAIGDIFLCCDSDDVIAKDALIRINEDFQKNADNDEICGAVYLKSFISDSNNVVGTKFPVDGMVSSYYDIYSKYKVSGDKLFVFKTKIAKQYSFPIIDNEKFIPEALLYNRISKHYNFICFNFIANYVEYLDSGYSNNYFELVKKNPKGNVLYFKELYDYDKCLYNVYGYILFSLFAKFKFKDILKNHKAKFKVLILFLPTYIIYLFRK